VLRETRTDIVAVRITSFEGGIFKAELDLMTRNGRVILDCRPTDGLILAMRHGVKAPILCDVSVLEALNQ
jgi:bifunctional DNase/RNase